MLHGVKQNHYGNRAFNDRQNDAKQDDKVVCAIDLCRFFQAVRDLRHGCAHHYQIPCINRHRQNQCQSRIIQPQITHGEIKGNQTSGQIHGKNDRQ